MAAVRYLNSVPLIWGLYSGPQKSAARLEFHLPSVCADRLADGTADIGLIPVIECARLNLPFVSELGIACRGAVRSILLISKTDPRRIRTLAADHGSRTSVMLTRILLTQRYGIDPAIVPAAPDLNAMLRDADAALIIGDPALRIDPASLPYPVLDLGEEWWNLTRLPMVFAMWAGRIDGVPLRESYEYGLSRMNDYLATESSRRDIDVELAREYLTRRIVYEIGDAERSGLQEFLSMAQELEGVPA